MKIQSELLIKEFDSIDIAKHMTNKIIYVDFLKMHSQDIFL